jgi:hypothetical protein
VYPSSGRQFVASGSKHGGFSDTEMTKAYAAIRSFLDKQNIVRQTTKEKPALPARLPALPRVASPTSFGAPS